MVPQPSSSRVCAGEASPAVSSQRARDRLMEWVALYIPTYGTSVVLHVAVGMLLALMIVTDVETAQPDTRWTAGFAHLAPAPEVERRPKSERPESRGRERPNDEAFFKRSPVKIRGIGEDVGLRDIPVIGIGPNRPGGGPGGFGDVFGGPREFFDLDSEEAARIVYVVDRSGSMSDSMDIVKAELKRSIAELDDDTEFHVIFFSAGPAVEMPTRRLVRATDRNRRLAYEFMDTVVAMSRTDPSHAIKRAFAVKPEVIYLLTDGEFDRGIVDLVKRLNTGGRVRVLTIGFLYRSGEQILKQIAAENGGEYTFVSETDLARLGA